MNCDKTSHIYSRCAWLHKKKPVATFVGVGGVGLGCFVAEHTKESANSEKNDAIALIKIKDGQEEEITEEMVENGSSTYLAVEMGLESKKCSLWLHFHLQQRWKISCYI
jgi:hypothetical protein